MTIFNHRLRTTVLTAALIGAALAPAAVRAEDQKVQFGLPGVPPVFVAVQQYVARDAGFFKKYGLDVQLRNFDSGTVAARAVQTGDIDISLSPTPVVIGITSNAGVDMVAIYGNENTDWVLATLDPKVKACADLKGQSIGVDTINGARSTALHQMMAPCGLKAGDVQEIALGSNVGQAMTAGQLAVGVLHIDDVPVVNEKSGKKVAYITTMKQVNPINHYMVLTTQRATLQKKRDTFVRLIAAEIEASRYMQDKKNWDKVAQMATITGHTASEAKAALEEYVQMEFWPADSDGLKQENVQAAIDIQVKTGGIREGKTPIAYDKLVDRTVYSDALAMVKAHGGS
jgi:NitT/TauT family transport system substrate-binding protein